MFFLARAELLVKFRSLLGILRRQLSADGHQPDADLVGRDGPAVDCSRYPVDDALWPEAGNGSSSGETRLDSSGRTVLPPLSSPRSWTDLGRVAPGFTTLWPCAARVMVQMRSVWIWVLIFMNMWERLECVRIIGDRHVNTIHFWVCIVAVSWPPAGSEDSPRGRFLSC